MRRLVHRAEARVFAASAMVGSCALGSALLTARALGADGRGQLAEVYAPYLLVATLAAGGIPYAFASVLHSRPMSRSTASAAVSVAGVLGVVGGLAVLGWAIAMETPGAWVATACLPAAVVYAVHLEYERQGGAGPVYNVTRVVPAGITLVACFVLLTLHVEGVSWYLAALLVPSAAVTLYLYCTRIGVFRVGRLSARCRPPREAIDLAFKAWPSAITDSLLSRFDQVLLAALVASRDLGIYAVAVLLAEPVSILRNGICAARFRSLSIPLDRELRRNVRRMLIVLSALALPSYIAVGVSAHIAERVLGSSFNGLPILTWTLLLGHIALDWHFALGTLLLAQKNPSVFSRSSAAALAIHLVALAGLVPVIGVLGAAIATVIGYAAASLMTGAAARKLLRNAPR